MEPRREETSPLPPPRRLTRLFKVLVVGGAMAAAAYATALQGPTGSPQDDTPSDGGGSPGW